MYLGNVAIKDIAPELQNISVNKGRCCIDAISANTHLCRGALEDDTSSVSDKDSKSQKIHLVRGAVW